MRDRVREALSDGDHANAWEALTPDFVAIFWSLSLCDIHYPRESYSRAIAAGETTWGRRGGCVASSRTCMHPARTCTHPHNTTEDSLC